MRGGTWWTATPRKVRLVGDETRTPAAGVRASTPEARKLWDLGIALATLAVDLSTLAKDLDPNIEEVLVRAQRKASDAEILVHDVRRELRALSRKKEP